MYSILMNDRYLITLMIHFNYLNNNVYIYYIYLIAMNKKTKKITNDLFAQT